MAVSIKRYDSEIFTYSANLLFDVGEEGCLQPATQLSHHQPNAISPQEIRTATNDDDVNN